MKRSKFSVKETLGSLYESIPAPEEKRPPFGNAVSKRILIVPLDEGRNHYFGGMNALAFINLFQQIVKEKVEDHFCVVPAAVYGKKINKASSTPLIEFIQKAQSGNLIDWVVCLGGEPFKHVFGKGYKPNMKSLAGNRIHLPKEHGDLNIYVFPDIEGMYHELQGDEQDYFRERDMRWNQDRMRKILSKYAAER